MFTNLCLVLLLPLAGSHVPKFHFHLTKNKLERSSGKGRTEYNLADGVTALAQLYALYSHGARSFNPFSIKSTSPQPLLSLRMIN